MHNQIRQGQLDICEGASLQCTEGIGQWTQCSVCVSAFHPGQRIHATRTYTHIALRTSPMFM